MFRPVEMCVSKLDRVWKTVTQTHQPKALHVVSCRWRNFHHVADAAETSAVVQGRPLHKRLEHLPSPLTVLLVASDPPHVEKGLDRFGALQVVCVSSLEDVVLLAHEAALQLR